MRQKIVYNVNKMCYIIGLYREGGKYKKSNFSDKNMDRRKEIIIGERQYFKSHFAVQCIRIFTLIQYNANLCAPQRPSFSSLLYFRPRREEGRKRAPKLSPRDNSEGRPDVCFIKGRLKIERIFNIPLINFSHNDRAARRVPNSSLRCRFVFTLSIVESFDKKKKKLDSLR